MLRLLAAAELPGRHDTIGRNVVRAIGIGNANSLYVNEENEHVRNLAGIGNVWNTIRELNVSEIREEAEARVTIALVGDTAARDPIVRALRGQPGRFPAAAQDALLEYDVPLRIEQSNDLRTASLIVLAIAGNLPATPELQRSADQLALAGAPVVVACLGSSRLPALSGGQSLDLGRLHVIFVPQPSSEQIDTTLLPELVEQIRGEERVAAARRLAGLRDAVTRALIGEASFSNATYALTSGISEIIPVLNLPLNAADLLVLTKNQALMVYRIGLAFGAPGDFQDQMREIVPVIGSGFMWRQIARQLVGLIPGFGIVPKVAVAYAGTYAVGQAAARWYARSEVLSKSALSKLYKQALAIGRERATDLITRRRHDEEANETKPEPERPRGLRRFLPRPKDPPVPPEK
jgi:uncharacterized protein (DUF697 family)